VTTALSGGLVVSGRLRVRGELLLEGCLHAGSIAVDAPTRVAVHADWRDRPLAGATVMTILEHGQ
jgi:cytoskeletal protein CcmA (bactofilin family)